MGSTCRFSLALMTLPPIRISVGVEDDGGGGGGGTADGTPPITPPRTPPGVPPGTPPTTPFAVPASGTSASSLMMLIFLGITVGAVSLLSCKRCSTAWGRTTCTAAAGGGGGGGGAGATRYVVRSVVGISSVKMSGTS